MRWVVMFVGVAAASCATTGGVCPSGARFASEDRPTGRVEWCAMPVAGATAIPAPGRPYHPSLLAMAHPESMSGGHRGPFTHWHPSGAVESHGNYIDRGSTSVPDGVWGFWYANGARKGVGRYERGQPVGCFAVWDEQGVQVTGVVDGDQLRVESCDPPVDGALTAIEMRSSPAAKRGTWGDATLVAAAQGGDFGASNATQRDPAPASRSTFQAVIRKHVGRFRIGPAVGLRLSNSDYTRAYTGGAVAAIALPLPSRRLGADVEAQLGVEYLDITATRPDRAGQGSAAFWSPLGSARFAVSFLLTSKLRVVGGARLDGSPMRTADREIQYCSPFCGRPEQETWNLGGLAYGFDFGLQMILR